MHHSQSTTSVGTPSRTGLSSSSSQRVLRRSASSSSGSSVLTATASLSQLLHEKDQRRQQHLLTHQLQTQPQTLSATIKVLNGSASTPGIRTSTSATSTGVATPVLQTRPTSAALGKTRVQFTSSDLASSASMANFGSPTRKSSVLSPSSANRALSVLPPMSPGQQTPLESSVESTALDLSPRTLASRGNTDLDLSQGLLLLRENLTSLVPNQLLRSANYRRQVDLLLSDLTRQAQHVFAASVAKSALLERSIDDKTTAEASERRYRQSISNLGLNSWGNLDELRTDIASIEREIVERGRFSVEDQTSLGVGLQFGIENVETKAEARARVAKEGMRGTHAVREDVSDLLGGVSDAASLPQSTSKLVYLKFRRLEQLIYILKRKLSALENYPHQAEIDRRYGSIDGLLAHCARLEETNARLEARLTGEKSLHYREEALLRPRDLTKCSTPFLHLLVVSLQQTLTSYMRVVDETVGVGRDFNNAKHPLYQAVKTWSQDMENETRKIGGAAGTSAPPSQASKRASTNAKDSTAAVAGTLAGIMALNLDPTADKIDIDQLYESMVAKKSSNASSTTDGGAHAGHSKVLRAATYTGTASNSSASSASAHGVSSAELATQLAAASQQVASLQAENELLRREARTAKWIEDLLRREGITAADDTKGGGDVSAQRSSVGDSKTSASGFQQEAKEPEDEANDDDATDEYDADRASSPPVDLFSYAPSLGVRVTDGDEEEDDEEEVVPEVPPTVVRPRTAAPGGRASRASDNANTSTNPAGPRISAVPRSLLTHLQSYSSEVARYRRFVTEYQRLHVSRESTLASVQREKARLVAVLLHLVKKHPQILTTDGNGNPSGSLSSATSSVGRRSSIKVSANDSFLHSFTSASRRGTMDQKTQ